MDAPGLRALQSAHLSFPGTVLIKSCSARSLRACCRLFSAPAMAQTKDRRESVGLAIIRQCSIAMDRGRVSSEKPGHECSVLGGQLRERASERRGSAAVVVEAKGPSRCGSRAGPPRTRSIAAPLWRHGK